MTQKEGSRFCDSCNKNVIDFTQKSRIDVVEFLQQNAGSQTCGRLTFDQLYPAHLESIDVIFKATKESKDPRTALALLIATSLLITGCDNPAKVPQKIKQPTAELPKKDTVAEITPAVMDSSFISPPPKTQKEEPVQLKLPDLPVEIAHPNEPPIDFSNEIVELGEIGWEPEASLPLQHHLATVKPEFPGGIDSLKAFIAKEIKWPVGFSGEERVFVSFVIDKTGKVKDSKILRGANELLEQEALRVISKMPAWTPGEYEGKAIEILHVIPINFKIQR